MIYEQDAIDILNDRFKSSNLMEGIKSTAHSWASTMGATGAGPYSLLPWAIYRTIRAKYDSCTKKCGTYELNTTRRQYCMSLCKENKAQMEYQKIKSINSVHNMLKN